MAAGKLVRATSGPKGMGRVIINGFETDPTKKRMLLLLPEARSLRRRMIRHEGYKILCIFVPPS